jgi:Fur family peroxide stress response transcriptional regulator
VGKLEAQDCLSVPETRFFRKLTNFLTPPSFINIINRESLFINNQNANHSLDREFLCTGADSQDMTDPQIRLEQMIANLKAHDFRITPQRLAVLKILAASVDHPSVELIYEQVKVAFPTTSLATIYKTVTLLKEVNEVLEIRFSEISHRYDGNKPFPHPHLICIKCKKILDPELMSIEKVIEEAAQQTGYQIVDHRLDFYGICPYCQKKA